MNGYPLASRWRRLGGYLLDLFIVGMILYLLMSLTGTVEQLRSEAGMSIGQQLIWAAVSLALFVALNGYLLAKDGRTLGKQLVGTQIVDLDGELLPLGKLIGLRYAIFILLALIPILGPLIGLLDSLWIFGREKRCLHDILAGTKVVFTAVPGLKYTTGPTLTARRILQGTALVTVVLIGLIIYRGSLIATGERLVPGNYQLAFLKRNPPAPGGRDVYVLDVEQNRVTQMTMNNKIAWMRGWTLDGQKMLLETESRRIPYLLNVSTGEVEPLSHTVTPGHNGWSPDGQQRAFSTQEEGDADPEIYIAGADGSEQRRLVQNPGADNDPAWSPDGQQVAFWTQQEGSWTLSIVKADGANLKQIAQKPVPSAPISKLGWAPDGSKLLFVSPTELDPHWGGIRATHVFIIGADGQNLIDVGEINWRIHPPSWSPDGRMIAFDGHATICVFDLDDDEPNCQYGAESPSWSPDGRYLAYAKTQFAGLIFLPEYICIRDMDIGRERCFEEITWRGTFPLWRP